MSTLRCVTGFLEVPGTASRTISPSSPCLPFTWAAGAKGLPTGTVELVSSSPDLYPPMRQEAELGEGGDGRQPGMSAGGREVVTLHDQPFGAECKVLRPSVPMALRGYYYSVFVGEEVGAQKS